MSNSSPAKPDGGEAMDRLIKGARLIGSSRMTRKLNPKEVTADQADRVLQRTKLFLEQHRVRQSDLARAIDVSTPVLCQVLRSNYKGNWQAVILSLDRWLEDELARRSMPKPTGFIWTGVAKEMLVVADMASKLNGIGVCFGESGIGKTLALKAIAAEKPASVFASMETVKASPKGVLDELSKAMMFRNPPGVRSTAMYVFDMLKEQLAGTPRLIILDQIHKLCTGSHDQALYTLTDLQDATGVPMLWCGTTDLVEYLHRRERGGREPLAQIRRRIVICRDLHERTRREGGGKGEALFTVKEIREVFARDRIRLTKDAVRFLAQLANLSGEGHLGDCRNLMVITTVIHKDADAIDADMLRSSQRLLASRRTVEDLRHRLEEDDAPAVAVAG